MRLTHYLCLVTLAGIAGCAPAIPPKAPMAPASINEGTILSMRPVGPRGSAEPLRAALLVDAGCTGAFGGLAGAHPAMPASVTKPTDSGSIATFAPSLPAAGN